SMEARVPAPRADFRPPTLAEPALKRLNLVEARVDEKSRGGVRHRWRQQSLVTIHEDTLHAFVNSPGFGVSRMPRVSEASLSYGLRQDPPVPNPGKQELTWSPGQWEDGGATDAGGLHELHQKSVLDFVYPEGFGVVKDRRNVYGFNAHQFSAVPRGERWETQAVELVGVLVHSQPVVYVSANLPRMDELRKAPTRPLDVFEAAG